MIRPPPRSTRPVTRFPPLRSSDFASARFELTRVGRDGKPRPGKGLEVTLVREHRDYHWNYDEDDGWDNDFTRRFENVEKKTIDSALAAVRFDFPVEWGEYRVDVFDPVAKLTMRSPFRAGLRWHDDNRGPAAQHGSAACGEQMRQTGQVW